MKSVFRWHKILIVELCKQAILVLIGLSLFALDSSKGMQADQVQFCISADASSQVDSCGEHCYLHTHTMRATAINKNQKVDLGSWQGQTRVEHARGHYAYNFSECCQKSCSELSKKGPFQCNTRRIENGLSEKIITALTKGDSGVCPLLFDERASCEKKQEEIISTGVADAEGKKHPGYSGWTLVQLAFSYPFWSERSTENGQTCLTTTDVMLQVEAAKGYPKKNIMQWSPEGSLSARCRAAKQKWQNEANAHESIHVRDANEYISKWGKRYPEGKKVKLSIKACGKNVQEANDKIADLLDKHSRIREEKTKLTSDIKKTLEEFHENPESRISLDCTECGK